MLDNVNEISSLGLIFSVPSHCLTSQVGSTRTTKYRQSVDCVPEHFSLGALLEVSPIKWIKRSVEIGILNIILAYKKLQIRRVSGCYIS